MSPSVRAPASSGNSRPTMLAYQWWNDESGMPSASAALRSEGSRAMATSRSATSRSEAKLRARSAARVRRIHDRDARHHRDHRPDGRGGDRLSEFSGRPYEQRRRDHEPEGRAQRGTQVVAAGIRCDQPIAPSRGERSGGALGAHRSRSCVRRARCYRPACGSCRPVSSGGTAGTVCRAAARSSSARVPLLCNVTATLPCGMRAGARVVARDAA